MNLRGWTFWILFVPDEMSWITPTELQMHSVSFVTHTVSANAHEKKLCTPTRLAWHHVLRQSPSVSHGAAFFDQDSMPISGLSSLLHSMTLDIFFASRPTFLLVWRRRAAFAYFQCILSPPARMV